MKSNFLKLWKAIQTFQMNRTVTLARKHRNLQGFSTIKSEFESLEQYIQVLQQRWDGLIEVSFLLDKAVAGCRIPSYMLHPLVDNAIRYGLKTSVQPVKISIEAVSAGADLNITIANTGCWLPYDKTKRSRHRGLDEVKAKVEASFPNRYRFMTYCSDGNVYVEILLRKACREKYSSFNTRPAIQRADVA